MTGGQSAGLSCRQSTDWDNNPRREIPIKKFIIIGAALVATLALPSAVMADTISTDFETFGLGSVDSQDGWHSAVPGDLPALPNGYDQHVKSSEGAPGVGGHSLRHSTAPSEATGEF